MNVSESPDRPPGQMLARDLAVSCPSIGMDDAASNAVRLIAEQNLPGIVVCERDGRPSVVLHSTQVLTFVIPPYVLDDATLARVMNEHDSERLVGDLAGKTVRDLVPAHAAGDIAVAQPDDTVLELAVLMARTHSPIVAIVEGHQLMGCVTLSRVLNALFAPRST